MNLMGSAEAIYKKELFRTWFLRQWAELDKREGRRTTQQDLAAYLDITRSAVAQYISGRNVPSGTNLQKVAAKFGKEVYEILEVPRPSDLDRFEFELRVRRAVTEATRIMVDRRIDPNSEEGEQILKDVLSKFSLDVNPPDTE